jgi:hypothetical protein
MYHTNFYRGGALAAGATPYTVGTMPSVADTAIVTNIIVANVTNAAHYITIKFDDVAIISEGPVNPYDTLVLDIRQVLLTGDSIYVKSDVDNALKVHISGVEITNTPVVS